MREIDLQTAVHEIVTATQRKTKENKADYPFFLIVGAGISYPSIPLAAGIEKLCREEITAQGLELPPEPKTAFERYQTYFELAFPHAEDRQTFLHERLHNVSISPANLRLAHLLGEGPLTNLVFTPNFDEMLSRALRLLGYEAILCDHPRTTQRIKPGSGRLQIVHVHGTHWFYDCCNLSGEVNDRSTVAPDGESMRDLLDQVLRDRSPIVVGYSGWEGDVIMSALKRRLIQTALPRNLYWFCFKRSEVEALPDWLKAHPSVRLVLPPLPHQPETAPIGSGLVEVAGPAPAPQSFEETDTDGSEPTLSAQQVFDVFNRRLDLKAPKLTIDPLGFFYENLKENLHADGDLLGTDLYSISEILRRVEKGAELEQEWRQRGSVVQRENLAALEKVRNAMRTAAYREAVETTRGINLDALDMSEYAELESILEQVYFATYGSDPKTGLDVCRMRSDILARALNLDPNNKTWVTKTAKALVDQGYCLTQLQREGEAIEAYRSAIQADPKNSMAWNNLGWRLGQKAEQEPENAPALRQEEIEAYRSAIQANPKNSQAWTNLGFRLGQRADQDPENAPALRQEEIEAYRSAIQTNPKNSKAWNNLGVRLGQRADQDPENALTFRQEEIEAYRSAIQADPKSAPFWYNLASALSAKGRTGDIEAGQEALKVLRQAATLEGSRYDHACALALTGSTDEALEELKGCLDHGEISREHVARDRDWDGLRDDPRFKELLQVR